MNNESFEQLIATLDGLTDAQREAVAARLNGPSEQTVYKKNEQVLIIEPGRTEQNYWMDIWRYRELFLILAWRDLAVRYKQTFIGVAWAIIRPFLTMVIFTVIFGHVAGLPSDGDAPYALLVCAGMLPWFLFSTALTEASGSLISNANLISKVYFPRLVVPVASIVYAHNRALREMGEAYVAFKHGEGSRKSAIDISRRGVGWAGFYLAT